MNSRSHTEPTLSVSGGIGNQLFQLAAGIALSKNRRLLVEASLRDPRARIDLTIEIQQYEWPISVEFLPMQNFAWLERKLRNYLLRLSSYKTVKNLDFYLNSLKIEVISKLLSHIFWRGSRIQVCRGVGYDEKLTSDISLFIGYFQSAKWVAQEEIADLFRNLKLRTEPHWLTKLRADAVYEKPIILHMRLGDYKNEQTFGIPHASYYESAVLKLWETRKFKRIWIFSDEINLAVQRLPQWIIDNSRLITEGQNAPAATIEAMRLGCAYVISNSTFGWWGAYLSHNENVPVIAPSPWFKGREEPLGIIPENWIRKDAWE